MDDPYTILEKKDNIHIFLSLCSFISICENKKINLANVFLLVLKENRYRELFKKLLELDSNYDLIKILISLKPSLFSKTWYAATSEALPPPTETIIQISSGSCVFNRSVSDGLAGLSG